MIINKNAISAGIYFFINYSKDNPTPRDFEIEKFKKICGCIQSNEDGEISLKNWNIELPNQPFHIEVDFSIPYNFRDMCNLINEIKEEQENYSLDSWIDNLKTNNEIWKSSTIEGIKVPIGKISPTQKFNFYLANDKDSECTDFFALIAGRPTYGKTVLLHNIIINSCMKYAPDELELYLADFAGGKNFSMYRKLPHAKSLMLSNNKEYALRMLKYVLNEIERRSQLFIKAARSKEKEILIENFAHYREVTGEKLPRILFVMDEFHHLFTSNDPITYEAKEVLCNGIRLWRQFGISIVLCTQTIESVNFGVADNNITYRFALNLLPNDSKSVIRNSAAQNLTGRGETIMNNTANGDEKMNVKFQAAYSTKYAEHVDYLDSHYKKLFGNMPSKYICETGFDANVSQNIDIVNLLEPKSNTINHQYCDVYVGKPDLLRDSHTKIRFVRQENSNLLFIGADHKSVVNTLSVCYIQILKQSHKATKFFILDCFNQGNPAKDALNKWSKFDSNFCVGDSKSVVNYISVIFDELERRKNAVAEDKMINERIVLSILNMQNAYDLKQQGDGYSAKPSESSNKLTKILREGPQLGIHSILHTLSYNSLFDSKNRMMDSIDYFEQKIFFKGADFQNFYHYFASLKKDSTIDKNGQMIVLNNILDNEDYEQCKAYSQVNYKTIKQWLSWLNKLT